MHKKILDYAVSKNICIYIADTSTTRSTLEEAIIEWGRKIWIPEMKKNEIKLIVTILPRDIIPQFSTFEWQKGDYGDIKLVNVISMDQVSRIINDHFS